MIDVSIRVLHPPGFELDQLIRLKVIEDTWPAYYLSGITWITDPKHEMAFSFLAYGNEASIGTQYCCVVLFAVIPPSGKRNIQP